MSFEKELHKIIDEWDLYVVEKIELEQEILKIYKKYKV